MALTPEQLLEKRPVNRARLEAHLDSVAQIRSQIAALAPVCTTPPQPSDAPHATPAGHAGTHRHARVVASHA